MHELLFQSSISAPSVGDSQSFERHCPTSPEHIGPHDWPRRVLPSDRCLDARNDALADDFLAQLQYTQARRADE